MERRRRQHHKYRSVSYNGAALTSTTWAYNGYFQIPDSSASSDTSTTKQVASTNPFVNAGGYDLRLKAGTSAGINTNATLPGNRTDMEGFTRGMDGTWDRGAFECNSYSRHSLPHASPPSP